MTPTDVEHMFLDSSPVSVQRVTASMTPTGVEHTSFVRERDGLPEVTASMTPTGVEQLADYLDDCGYSGDRLDDADRRWALTMPNGDEVEIVWPPRWRRQALSTRPLRSPRLPCSRWPPRWRRQALSTHLSAEHVDGDRAGLKTAAVDT